MHHLHLQLGRVAPVGAKVAEGLARAAIAGALENVRVNVEALSDPALGLELLEQAERITVK